MSLVDLWFNMVTFFGHWAVFVCLCIVPFLIIHVMCCLGSFYVPQICQRTSMLHGQSIMKKCRDTQTQPNGQKMVPWIKPGKKFLPRRYSWLRIFTPGENLLGTQLPLSKMVPFLGHWAVFVCLYTFSWLIDHAKCLSVDRFVESKSSPNSMLHE